MSGGGISGRGDDRPDEAEVHAMFAAIGSDPGARDEIALRFQPLVEYSRPAGSPVAASRSTTSFRSPTSDC